MMRTASSRGAKAMSLLSHSNFWRKAVALGRSPEVKDGGDISLALSGISTYLGDTADGHSAGYAVTDAAFDVAGAWAVAEAGAEGGAILGSFICPGVGTLIGGVIGGIAGGLIGGWLGGQVMSSGASEIGWR